MILLPCLTVVLSTSRADTLAAERGDEGASAIVARFALVADPHISLEADRAMHAEHFERVIAAVNAAGVDAVLIAGDLTQRGRPDEFLRYSQFIEQFRARVWMVPGNHDVGPKPLPDARSTVSAERVERYERMVGRSFYETHPTPGVRVVGINASLLGSDLPMAEAQWDFLERVLTPQPHTTTLLLTHYPLFVEHLEEAADYFNIDPGPRMRLLRLLQRGNVRAVLAGHTHRPLSHAVGEMQMITAPPVSFGLPRGRQPVGWTLVLVDAAGRVSGEVRYLANLEMPEAEAAKPAPRQTVSTRVHAFYYNWYGAPPFQERYIHWPQGGHQPPDAIGANYFPSLGAYSSSDPKVLQQHMRWLREARVGVLSLSWWGQGSYEDRLTPGVLDAAAAEGLAVNFHLEPYPGRTPQRVAGDVRYIVDRYGSHSAFYRAEAFDRRPMFYIYEMLDHPAQAWRHAIAELRGTPHDALVIAQTTDLGIVIDGGFDGGYSYDALALFRQPGLPQRWRDGLAPAFAAAGKLFIPSVGPGYWDDRAVPRGADEPAAARTRDDGTARTYERAWRAATEIGSPFVTVTSFNEWHEGSQIEPAVHRETADYSYPAYAGGSTIYLRRTAEAVARFEAARDSKSMRGGRH